MGRKHKTNNKKTNYSGNNLHSVTSLPLQQSRITSLTNNRAVKIIGSVILAIFLVWLGYYLPTRETAEADLTIKNYTYLRESPKYRVYEVTFTINNSGNQDFSLSQAVPFSKGEKLTFLQNNNCELFKDATIESGRLKDFTIHVFVKKDEIELTKNAEKRTPYFIDPIAGKIKNTEIKNNFNVEIKAVIYGSDKKYRGAISAPFPISYTAGKEREQNTPLTNVNFEEIERVYFDCPIKNQNQD